MERAKELNYFKILEKEVIERFRNDFSYVPEDPSQWKMTHISYFQESLFKATKGTFSDRWFYTYFKNDPEKLPRIDMLNILSQYAGYENWGDFINQHREDKNTENSQNTVSKTTSSVSSSDSNLQNSRKPKINKSTSLILFSLLIIGILIGVYAWVDHKNHTYRFYFRDNDRDGQLRKGIRVHIPSNYGEPKLISDEEGKVEIYSRNDKKEDTIEMYIESPFYRKDTFDIVLYNSDGVEYIDLTPNDYTLMVNYYSHSNNVEVDKRRKELNQLIAKDALIYQVYDNEDFGQEVLTKEQYINLMTAPTESLKNFEMISSQEENGKIVKIKFKIVPNEEPKN